MLSMNSYPWIEKPFKKWRRKKRLSQNCIVTLRMENYNKQRTINKKNILIQTKTKELNNKKNFISYDITNIIINQDIDLYEPFINDLFVIFELE